MREITLRVEAAVGGAQTTPMIVMDSGISGTVKNWSSKMRAEMSLSIAVHLLTFHSLLTKRFSQMSYFNDIYSVWEPLIEQVPDESGALSPWDLTIQVAVLL